MNRRQYIATIGSGITIGLSGCVSDESSEDSPQECPVTQDLNVSPPDEFDVDSTPFFVHEYEAEYMREEIEETYEERNIVNRPSTSVRGSREENPGFVVETSTTWSVITKEGVTIEAQPQDQIPDNINPVNVDELPNEAELAVDIALRAVTEREVQQLRDEDQNYDQLVSQLKSAQDSTGTYYVVAEDTPVSLEIEPHTEETIDESIIASYYVDDVVARRTEEENEINATDGRVVECFNQ